MKVLIIISFVILSLLLSILFFEFQKEKRRNRILQSFMAGLIKSMSDYVSKTDMIDIRSSEDLTKIFAKRFPIPYKEILKNISREFEKDFWMNPHRKWIKKDRNLFYDGKYANDGFNFIYWDFFDMAITETNRAIEKEKEQTPNRTTTGRARNENDLSGQAGK